MGEMEKWGLEEAMRRSRDLGALQLRVCQVQTGSQAGRGQRGDLSGMCETVRIKGRGFIPGVAAESGHGSQAMQTGVYYATLQLWEHST